jgi:endonuclease/exonuclease/phosphatase (EEP) superfamily protein YafD
VVRVLRPERWTFDVAVTAATPWLLAPSWALLAGALIGRRRRLATVAAALAAYHAACARPRSPRGLFPLRDGPVLRVAFANLWWRNHDVRGALGELAGGQHDIVALAEVTDSHLAAVDALFPRATYPWRWCAPEGSEGLAVVSRVPFDRVEKWSSQGHPQLDMVVEVPGASPVRLLVVHTWGPVGRPAIKRWRRQLAEIAARAQGAPAGPGEPLGAAGVRTAVGVRDAAGERASADAQPTAVVGDFNATHQHRSFRRLIGSGWTDAGTAGPGGWRATWPANHRWFPALFNIDHILAGPGISVRSARAGRGRGSDHRPVSAVLVLGPTGP